MKLQNLKRQLQLQEWASQLKAQSEKGIGILKVSNGIDGCIAKADHFTVTGSTKNFFLVCLPDRKLLKLRLATFI